MNTIKKIHIALVGREALPVFYTIMEHNPDITYLLVTEQTNETAANLKKVMGTLGQACQTIQVLPYDIKRAEASCEAIHEKHGETAEYVYNLTGGTKVMSLGAYRCGERHEAQLLYTDSRSCIDLRSGESVTLSESLVNETIFALQGQQLKHHKVWQVDDRRTACARACRQFILGYGSIYHELHEAYQRRQDSHRPGAFAYARKGLTYSNRQGVSIEEDGETVFASDFPGAEKMLLEGRWWETLVADKIVQWSAGRYAVWASVEFWPLDPSARDIKNEIDVLVNVGNTFVIVECKSGTFTQDNVYKLASVCRTYGSYKSKGVIVTFRDCRSALKEKAKEQNISIFEAGKNLSRLGRELDRIVSALKA